METVNVLPGVTITDKCSKYAVELLELEDVEDVYTAVKDYIIDNFDELDSPNSGVSINMSLFLQAFAPSDLHEENMVQHDLERFSYVWQG